MKGGEVEKERDRQGKTNISRKEEWQTN